MAGWKPSLTLRRPKACAAACLLALGLCPPAADAEHLREVRIGVYANQPKIFLDERQELSGIFGDLVKEIASLEHWQLTPVACEWQDCLEQLRRGDLDLMPDVGYTAERARQLDFHTTPALLSWSQIYAAPSINVHSALDLAGKRIAVLRGSVQEEYLRNLLAGFGITATLQPTDSLPDAFGLAASGAVDAAVANRFFGDYQAPRYKLTSTAVLFQPTQLFFATGKGRNADLLAGVETRVREWQADPDSPYFTILKRWMQEPLERGIPQWVWLALTGLLGVLAMAVLVNRYLGKEVAAKTRSLRASEDRLNAILDGVDAHIYIKDPDLRYQYANRKLCDLFGAGAEDIVGKTDASFFDTETSTQLQVNDLRVIQRGERVENEEHIRDRQGGYERTYLSVKMPLRKADGSIYALCGISTDITRQKQAESDIHQLAFYDALTHLPNRRLLMERLKQALSFHKRSNEHGALLFIDVDNFKDLNDTLGHNTGDLLLSGIAARLNHCTRAQDTVARQGGDEFVVLALGLRGTPEEATIQAKQLAEKILRQLGQPYALEDHVYQTTVSIGVTMFSGPDSDQDELLKQADLAMYQAKADGRNTVRFFNPAMQAQVSARTALEKDLHLALERDQFELFAQPQVDAEGCQFGVEALVRWRHPVRGLVSPAEFIPVAESSGLILPLGRWILETACKQLVEWARDPATRDFSVAVNISAHQFRQTDFVQQVESILQATGANAHKLELELTESQLIDDISEVIQKMDALKTLGVRMALDDFGTGYSSLNVLKRLPLDQLKIDQSFVKDLLQDDSSASIVRAIVMLGESLQLQVIAEGVETEAQRHALAGLGCTHYQGYLFGRPAPLREPKP